MATIFTPINQKRLTNVAIVRLNSHGKRFEIACYQNKVVSWRSGVEKDINEVLQTHTVFSNVSKGQIASNEHLEKAFKTTDHYEICKIIIAKGELQISDKERTHKLQAQNKEIVQIICNKCINPETKFPYTPSMIEKALKDIHFSIKPGRSSKQQALEAIRQLGYSIPIQRARLKLQICGDIKDCKAIKIEVNSKYSYDISSDTAGNEMEIELEIDPGDFRKIEEIVLSKSKGKCTLNLLSTNAAQTAGDFL